MDVVIIGNVTLDVVCYPVEDVPRFDSLAFERSIVSPGGCGSNVAIGLAAQGVDVSLVANCGSDDTAKILLATWQRWGIDMQYVRQIGGLPTAVSVALVDRQMQPRFVHAPGSNSSLTADFIDIPSYVSQGAKILGVAGFFILLGFLDGKLADKLFEARQAGLLTILDVVHSPRMVKPDILWPILPGLDVFLCNIQEAELLTGKTDPVAAANIFYTSGARNVIVKLGKGGCLLLNHLGHIFIPGINVPDVVDTTGAGDAFAAGLMAGLVRGLSIEDACLVGNQAGARIVTELGTVQAWGEPGEIRGKR